MACCFGGVQRPTDTLLAAASSGDAAACAAALRRGADVEFRDPKLGATPLMHAALNGHASVLEVLLLQASPAADVRAKDRVGDTALHWAALNGHAAAVTLLLAAGADVGDRNGDGDSARDMAGRGVGVDARAAEAVRTVLSAAAPCGVALRPRDGSDDFSLTVINAAPAPAVTAVDVGADWELDVSQLRFREKLLRLLRRRVPRHVSRRRGGDQGAAHPLRRRPRSANRGLCR